MNVCYIITSTIKCGPVNVLYGIVKNYKKINGFHPYIITLKDDEKERSRRDEFRKLGIDVQQFDWKNDFEEIKKYIKENKIDIVHSHGLKPDLVNSKLKKIYPSLVNVTTLHNYPFEDYVINRGWLKGNLMAFLQLYATKNLYKIACSKAIQKKYNEKLNKKIDMVENGVEYPSEKSVKIKKNKRSIFLYLGDIHRRKNVNFLVDYFALHPEYELWIVGDGSNRYYEEIVDKAKNINNIILWGRTSNPGKFYQKADFLISDSMSEGLPMTVLEAYSHGLPVILSDIDAHKETLIDDECGKIFNLDDKESLDNKIKEAEKTNYNYLKIYKKTKSIFSSSAMMNNYIEIYKRLLG